MNGTKIRVIDDYHEEITRHGTGDWDNDDTYQYHSIDGFIVVEDGYYDFQCAIEDIDWERTYHLVYVNYDTGDSFGRYGGKVSFVDLFESRELAFALAEAIEENAKAYGNRSNWDYKPLKYKVDDGTERECHTSSWLGYFESLNEVRVKSVQRERKPTTGWY
jgi:hypothetical protein